MIQFNLISHSDLSTHRVRITYTLICEDRSQAEIPPRKTVNQNQLIPTQTQIGTKKTLPFLNDAYTTYTRSVKDKQDDVLLCLTQTPSGWVKWGQVLYLESRKNVSTHPLHTTLTHVLSMRWRYEQAVLCH